MLDTSSKQELAEFYNQFLCSPPVSTILGILTRHPDKLLSFPGLNRRLVTKHLPPSTATHSKRPHNKDKERVKVHTNDEMQIIDAQTMVDNMAPTEEACTVAGNIQ